MCIWKNKGYADDIVVPYLLNLHLLNSTIRLNNSFHKFSWVQPVLLLWHVDKFVHGRVQQVSVSVKVPSKIFEFYNITVC